MHEPTPHDVAWMQAQEARAFYASSLGAPVERILEGVCPAAEFRVHIARYRFLRSFVAGRRVLDAACGTGYGSHYLARVAGAASVTGLDVDAEALRYARLRYTHPALRYLQHDVSVPFGTEPFDVIASFETIEHVPNPEAVLAAFAARLAPEGTLVISTPWRHGGKLTDAPLNPHHVREWNLAEFKELLGARFRRVEWYGQRWYPGARVLGVPLPGRIALAAARVAGATEKEIGERLFDVLPLQALPPWYTRPRPEVIVGVCREPRR